MPHSSHEYLHTTHHRANPTSSDTYCRQGTAAVTRPDQADRDTQRSRNKSRRSRPYCSHTYCSTKPAHVHFGTTTTNQKRWCYRRPAQPAVYGIQVSLTGPAVSVFYRTGTCSITTRHCPKKTLGTWVQAKGCVPLCDTTNQGVMVHAGKALWLAAFAVGECPTAPRALQAKGPTTWAAKHCRKLTNLAHFYKHCGPT
jgi:hypothetical protein